MISWACSYFLSVFLSSSEQQLDHGHQLTRRLDSNRPNYNNTKMTEHSNNILLHCLSFSSASTTGILSKFCTVNWSPTPPSDTSRLEEKVSWILLPCLPSLSAWNVLDHSYAEARVDNVDRIFLPRARISKCSLNWIEISAKHLQEEDLLWPPSLTCWIWTIPNQPSNPAWF